MAKQKSVFHGQAGQDTKVNDMSTSSIVAILLHSTHSHYNATKYNLMSRPHCRASRESPGGEFIEIQISRRVKFTILVLSAIHQLLLWLQRHRVKDTERSRWNTNTVRRPISAKRR